MKPIDLLKQELANLISAREHSVKALKEGKIDSNLHEQHIHNLNPIIDEYRYIIRVINQYA